MKTRNARAKRKFFRFGREIIKKMNRHKQKYGHRRYPGIETDAQAYSEMSSKMGWLQYPVKGTALGSYVGDAEAFANERWWNPLTWVW